MNGHDRNLKLYVSSGESWSQSWFNCDVTKSSLLFFFFFFVLFVFDTGVEDI